MTNKLKATPAKLRSGDWGARVVGEARVGDTVQITTKAGKTWEATVTSVIWTGDGITLVATQSLDRPGRKSGCECTDDCCAHGCRCHSQCNCRGGNIYDC